MIAYVVLSTFIAILGNNDRKEAIITDKKQSEIKCEKYVILVCEL